jgi:hypothetical protein
MEPERAFVFSQNQRLFSVSRLEWAGEAEEIYFTTVEEAVLSIFHSAPGHWTRRHATYGEYQLRIYSVLTTLEIRERAPPDLRQVVTFGNSDERTFGQNLKSLCPPNAPGYWVEVPVGVPTSIDDNDEIVVPELSAIAVTGFTICSPSSLIHIRSLNLDLLSLLPAIFSKRELFQQQGLDLTVSKLADMIKDTLVNQSQNYLEIIPIDAPRVSELPPASQGTGLTPGLPLFAPSPSARRGLPGMSQNASLRPAAISPQDPAFEPAYFDTLPKDLVFYIASNMTFHTISRFCRTSQTFNRLICDNEQFWANKLAADFPREASAKPDDITFKAYYQSTWNATRDPHGLIDKLKNITRGFTTAQLIGILLAFSTTNPAEIAAGIPPTSQIVDYLEALSGGQWRQGLGRRDLYNYLNWVGRKGLGMHGDLPRFDKFWSNTPFAPLNEHAVALERVRGTIYDGVVTYLNNPILIQRLDNPPVPAPLEAQVPWARMGDALRGTGFKRPADLRSGNIALLGQYYRVAFQRAWSLTQRDVEPEHQAPFTYTPEGILYHRESRE